MFAYIYFPDYCALRKELTSWNLVKVFASQLCDSSRKNGLVLKIMDRPICLPLCSIWSLALRPVICPKKSQRFQNKRIPVDGPQSSKEPTNDATPVVIAMSKQISR